MLLKSARDAIYARLMVTKVASRYSSKRTCYSLKAACRLPCFYGRGRGDGSGPKPTVSRHCYPLEEASMQAP